MEEPGLGAVHPVGSGGTDTAAALVLDWERAITRSSFVPGSHGQVLEFLSGLLDRLRAALAADGFDASAGHAVGRDLVAGYVSSPGALGDTVALLSRRLTGPRDRLDDLIGAVATGFTEALRERALIAAEDIGRAERKAWRDQQNRLQLRLQHALLHDRLTALPNRTRLLQWLTAAAEEAGPDARFGFCLVDLDRFTAINHSLGVDKADELLVAAAERLAALTSRDGHFLAHLGGDVFGIAVEGTTGGEDVVKVADRALRVLSQPFRLDRNRLTVTARAGVVEGAVRDLDPHELLRAAHITAKAIRGSGPSRWAVFDPNRGAADLRRHALSADLPAAIDRGEVRLDYQPMVRLSDDAVVAVEALARWYHPEHGRIPPVEFIPLAEDTGLIVPLGLALLRRACADAAAWHHRTAGPLMVSVNLSVAQLRHPGLVADVMAALDDAGLPPERLQLEVTESIVLPTDTESLSTLHTLARKGVRLAIDDFGTGYSSFAYLTELPFHTVKLPAPFLRGLAETDAPRRSNRTILPALISMSHDLGLTVTAEHIETAAEAVHLSALGCDHGQGYHFGRPQSAEDITRMLA